MVRQKREAAAISAMVLHGADWRCKELMGAASLIRIQPGFQEFHGPQSFPSDILQPRKKPSGKPLGKQNR